MHSRLKSVSHVLAVSLALAFVVVAAERASGQAPGKKSDQRAAQKKTDETIDFNKARRLLRKSRAGQKLTKEEQAYLDRAIAARRKKAGGRKQAGKRPEPKSSLDLKPLTGMTSADKYKGQDGGLYGGGKNTPPAKHLKAALAEAAKIQPLDAEGKPAKDGKIVLISNGMSNATQEFSRFIRLANADEQKSPSVVIVDGAFGGMVASRWANPANLPRKGKGKSRPSPWEMLARRLKQAGVSPRQVQVVWFKQAEPGPASLGEFPKHAQKLKDNLVVVLQKLKQRYPNLRLAYLSSRIYAGYARTGLNPEPYAYESAFSIRWLIDDQMQGKTALNYDAARGKVQSPLLLWGPYLWANGVKGRKLDDLVWKESDFARDGTHPGISGRDKVARQLLKFFKTDPTAKTWFVR
jgi:hypothetical protein